MMSKLKKMFVALIAVATLATPQLAAQQPVAAKYVDQDGFALSINNGGYVIHWLEDLYNAGTEKLVAKPTFKIVDNIIREFWTENNFAQIGSTAVSGKEISPDFYSVKQFVELPAAKRTGALWKISQGSQALSYIGVMPKHTIAAAAFDFNAAELLAMVDRYVNKFGNQEVKDAYKAFFAEGLQNGVDVKAIANSVRGIALCVEADPARLVAPGYSSATLYLSVKDQTLMNAIVKMMKEKNPEIVTVNNELMIPAPFGMVAVFQQGNYIVATTDFAGAKKLIAGEAPSLKQNPDYIKYAAGMPDKGDAFIFISSELGKTVIPAYLPFLPPELTQMLDVQKLCNVIGIGPALYCVGYANQEGYGSICNTGSKGIAVIAGNPAMSALFNSLTFLLLELANDDPEPVEVSFDTL